MGDGDKPAQQTTEVIAQESPFAVAARICVEAERAGAEHYPGKEWGMLATLAAEHDLTADDLIREARNKYGPEPANVADTPVN